MLDVPQWLLKARRQSTNFGGSIEAGRPEIAHRISFLNDCKSLWHKWLEWLHVPGAELEWSTRLSKSRPVSFSGFFWSWRPAISRTIRHSSVVFFCQVFCQAAIDVTSREPHYARLLDVLNSEMAISDSYDGEVSQKQSEWAGAGIGRVSGRRFPIIALDLGWASYYPLYPCSPEQLGSSRTVRQSRNGKACELLQRRSLWPSSRLGQRPMHMLWTRTGNSSGTTSSTAPHSIQNIGPLIQGLGRRAVNWNAIRNVPKMSESKMVNW